MARTKTDQEILNEVFRELFGEQKQKGRTRYKDPTDFILWKADGKWFRNRKNALATGQKPVRHTFDAEFLWEDWNNEGYEMIIEDMSHDAYLVTLEQKHKEFHGIA